MFELDGDSEGDVEEKSDGILVGSREDKSLGSFEGENEGVDDGLRDIDGEKLGF